MSIASQPLRPSLPLSAPLRPSNRAALHISILVRQLVREYFHQSMHLHRARANARLYTMMNTALQGTVIRAIPWHQRWMSSLESRLNRGREGLFKDGDRVRVEVAANGQSSVLHLPSGIKTERSDFNQGVEVATEVRLKLEPAEEAVGATVAFDVPVGGEAPTSATTRVELFNIEAVCYRRPLRVEGAVGVCGLATLPGDLNDRWSLLPRGRLFVSDPVALPSLPPAEPQFSVEMATSLTPLMYNASELLPIGRVYIIHRGLALLRQRWFGVGTQWGLEMVLSQHYTQQYAAVAVSLLEVYAIGRDEFLAIASKYPQTAKRLRRWTILTALRQYLIANYHGIRSGLEPLEARLQVFSGAGAGAHNAPPAAAPALEGGGDSKLREEVAALKHEVRYLHDEILRRLPLVPVQTPASGAPLPAIPEPLSVPDDGPDEGRYPFESVDRLRVYL